MTSSGATEGDKPFACLAELITSSFSSLDNSPFTKIRLNASDCQSRSPSDHLTILCIVLTEVVIEIYP